MTVTLVLGGARSGKSARALTVALRSACRPGRAVVVDCLTLWLSSLMHHGRPMEREMTELCDAIRTAASCPAATLILVSNEVGAGIVPAAALAREFRDAQGRLNQLVAGVSDRVELVIAGLPLVVKPVPGADYAPE